MKFDHILVMTDDLQQTGAFFRDLAKLELGPRPPFSFPGAWLYSEGRPVVHLAQAQTEGADAYVGRAQGVAASYVDHIAFVGDDLAAFLSRLAESGLPHFERFVPESGEHQIFVTGPGGMKLEFIFR
ncbi:hypothetical protein AQZ50_15710 [Novosphingobium sp. Fuku2-ISO-50]|nr:hypothetical protein AQZ50_15710 [Novosphingobium sp. Fuku2-ISO-50]